MLEPLHQPLRPGQTRLVTLKSGEWEDDIVCSLHAINLDDKPVYTATSYFCGSQQDLVDIWIEGRSVPVYRTLDTCLRQTRRLDEDIVIWADAISINQADDDEKSWHIIQMGRIYSQAAGLVVSLGDSYDESDTAVDILKSATQDFTKAKELNIAGVDDRRPKIHGINNVKLAKVRSLMSRPYFTRSWTVQEFILTPNARMYCGEQSFSWVQMAQVLYLMSLPVYAHYGALVMPPNQTGPHILEVGVHYTPSLRFAEEINTLPHHQLFNTEQFESWWSTSPPMEIVKYRPQWTFYYTLIDFIDRDCCRAEGKIWSIRSLAMDLQDDELQPLLGQKETPGEVFTRATRLVVEKTQSLKVLALCQSQSNTSDVHRPSWVPNFWRIPLSERPAPLSVLGFPSVEKRVSSYQATAGSQAGPKFSPDGYGLTLEGYIVGTVDLCKATPMQSKSFPYSWTREESQRMFTEYVYCLEFFGENVTLIDVTLQRTTSNSAKEDSFYESVGDRFYPLSESELGERVRRVLMAGQNTKSAYRDWWFTFSDVIFEFFKGFRAPKMIEHWGRFQFRRSLIQTTGGNFGLAPEDVQEGDLICLLPGAEVPFVLRRQASQREGLDHEFILLGECYVEASTEDATMNGIMDGSVFRNLEAAGTPTVSFSIY